VLGDQDLPAPAGGYTLPDTLAGFRGAALQQGRTGNGGQQMDNRGRGERSSPTINSWICH